MEKKKQYLMKRVVTWLAVQGFCTVLLLLLLTNYFLRKEMGIPIICGYVVLMLLHIYLGYRSILCPFREMDKTFQVFAEGYTVRDIFVMRYALTPSHEQMLRHLQEMLDAKEFLNSSKKQAEYLALQNQINPHFLYNTLEGIRSEALISGKSNIAKMTETLANFFRYTISNLDTLATVEDEITNVNNYYLIQQYRFGNRMELGIEYMDADEASIINCKMPKLILQPVVENAIRHGIEPMIEKGMIRIRFQLTRERLLIFISDNGIGMEHSQLEELNSKLRGTSLDIQESDPKKTKGGIAMINVNNRIKLIYGDQYGMRFYSTPGLGTDVEIILPIVRD